METQKTERKEPNAISKMHVRPLLKAFLTSLPLPVCAPSLEKPTVCSTPAYKAYRIHGREREREREKQRNKDQRERRKKTRRNGDSG
jgi:hypothetical protein